MDEPGTSAQSRGCVFVAAEGSIYQKHVEVLRIEIRLWSHVNANEGC